MESQTCTVSAGEEGTRIDVFVSSVCSISRTLAQKMIDEGLVAVQGKAVAKRYLLSVGEEVAISIPPPKDLSLKPQDIPLAIVYEDAHLLVVDKPKGMVVHPAPGHEDGTLVNAVMHHCGGSLSGIGGELRPGIVHRIDKDTSGLLVVAKDDRTHTGLAEQFASHSMVREYQAVVYGRLKSAEGFVEASIGRSRKSRIKMEIGGIAAKYAYTSYHMLEQYDGFAHVALRLKTGRTHQIRVHMASIGHPVAGDPLYGPQKLITKLNGQCLHAGVLGFIHPVSGDEMLFTSELPPYFTSFLGQLRQI